MGARGFMLTAARTLAVLSLLTSCLASAQDATGPAAATAVLEDSDGVQVGTARFEEDAEGLHVTVEVTGSSLAPGAHGTHVHESGECAPGPDPDGRVVPFGAAGGHFDPNVTRNHDDPEADAEASHAGDLPMIEVQDGEGRMEFTTANMTLRDAPLGVLNRALIVHADEDDFETDPGGGSGARVACGVILADDRALIDRLIVPGTTTFPEGIALAPDGSAVFTGSSTNGNVYRLPLDGGEARLVSLGGSEGRTTALGMEVDDRGRLWVAGGDTGRVAIVDPESGESLQVLSSTEPAPHFVNDLVHAADGHTYATDSFVPVLYRAPTGEPGGVLESWLDLRDTPIRYEPNAINLNGIVAGPDASYLIVAQSNTGQLWRVDVGSGDVTQITLDEPVPGADGLVLDGDRLLVVRNRAERVDVLRLDDSLASATREAVLEDPHLLFPTTGVLEGGDLLVVNAQLDAMDTMDPVLPFHVARMEMPTAE